MFAGIAKHQALRKAVWETSEDDPAFENVFKDQETAIQALGDMLPSTVAGAAAQLAYIAEVEGDFTDEQSPLLRTVLTVAQGLAAMSRRVSE